MLQELDQQTHAVVGLFRVVFEYLVHALNLYAKMFFANFLLFIQLCPFLFGGIAYFFGGEVIELWHLIGILVFKSRLNLVIGNGPGKSVRLPGLLLYWHSGQRIPPASASYNQSIDSSASFTSAAVGIR